MSPSYLNSSHSFLPFPYRHEMGSEQNLKMHFVHSNAYSPGYDYICETNASLATKVN